MAKKESKTPKRAVGKTTKHPPKAGRNRARSMESYYDSAGKRHWRTASSKKK